MKFEPFEQKFIQNSQNQKSEEILQIFQNKTNLNILS